MSKPWVSTNYVLGGVPSFRTSFFILSMDFNRIGLRVPDRLRTNRNSPLIVDIASQIVLSRLSHPPLLVIHRMLLNFSGGLSLAVEGPSKVHIDTDDNKKGLCRVKYVCPIEGLYEVLIKFDGQHVVGSPFKVRINGKTTIFIPYIARKSLKCRKVLNLQLILR